MQQLHLTLDTPAANLALDEALLDAAEAGEIGGEILRIWELPEYCVVLGRSSDAQVEVALETCRRDGVPVLRRSSGGGTILAGPGCLMYSLVLSIRDRPQLSAIDHAHSFVLQQLSRMLSTVGPEIEPAGTSDLSLVQSDSIAAKKFSGNSMRMKRDHLLYHGTLLYDFELSKIERWLATPTRTPEYRQDRQHTSFVTNLAVEKSALIQTLLDGWQVGEPLQTWPEQQTARIVETKYTGHPKWVVLGPTT